LTLDTSTLTDDEAIVLAYDWDYWRRPEQAQPPDVDEKGVAWNIWLMLAGRGTGKTRVGAETVREWMGTGVCRRMHLVARTARDVRDTMVEGESGILAVCEGDCGGRPDYQPSKSRLVWPDGGQAALFTAEKYDLLRGPQCDGWWADELAAWQYAQAAWDMLQMGARLGDRCRGLVTTTPRPIKVIKDLMARKDCVVVRGSTYDNIANLSGNIRETVLSKYEGTRLGRQELLGEILDDNPLALWRRADIDDNRAAEGFDPTTLNLIVTGVDPAITATVESDDTGIVVIGRDDQYPPHFYVLDDATVSAASPDKWGKAVIAAHRLNRGDRIVAEANQGGDMVISTIKQVDPTVLVRKVHASRGKRTRAEPISALYEQGRVHHVGFSFDNLEEQMCEWEPGQDSPDRMDALVWAITAAMEGAGQITTFDRHKIGF